jgi:uncharacterized repeat protein (TIGR04076 family)
MSLGMRMICGAKDGDYFTLQGEMLYLPPGQGISIYSLGEFDDDSTLKLQAAQHRLTGAVLPLLAAKQRFTHTNDWMTSDAEIACPDPHCRSRLKIVRTSVRTFSHSQVTVVPVRFLSLYAHRQTVTHGV